MSYFWSILVDWWKDHSHASWGETYTNVITQRNDTCIAIVKEVTCVGTPPNKIVYLGRTGEKQKKMVKMCRYVFVCLFVGL